MDKLRNAKIIIVFSFLFVILGIFIYWRSTVWTAVVCLAIGVSLGYYVKFSKIITRIKYRATPHKEPPPHAFHHLEEKYARQMKLLQREREDIKRSKELAEENLSRSNDILKRSKKKEMQARRKKRPTHKVA